jgi:drug/metabolite transporter (DMT)-like permease
MSGKRTSHWGLALSLLFAVILWGGNNTGTKFIVSTWPPVFTGGSRFLLAGLLMLALLKWTQLFGQSHSLTRDLKVKLWWRGGLSLAAYIVIFNTALRYTSASHVALYLGAAPIWALLWDSPFSVRDRHLIQRYAAAILALSGVFVLFWPALRRSTADWRGETLGLVASVLWTNYGRQCREFGAELSGAETSAHTMWRAGLLLMPIGLIEVTTHRLPLRGDILLVQGYCIIAGGVAAFAIWNNALRRWQTSQVLLFNNLIPLSTMTWAHFWLRETIIPTFWLAMCLVLVGVLLGQTNWQNLFSRVAPD